MSRIEKGLRSSKLRPCSRRKTSRAPKGHKNKGQVCDTPVQLASPQPQPEAHEDPTREAMNQDMDDGTETAALRATSSQVDQDNAPAAENDTSDAKDESIRAQPPTTSPLDGVGVESSVSGGVEARPAQDPQLADIQSIVKHRTMGERFELQCILATGKKVWFSETDVQEVCSPAVCTYWNCNDGFERPKDLVPPAVLRVLDRCPEKPDHLQVQMVGDPIFSGTNPEKKQFFEHKWIQNSTCKLIFNYESMYLPETELLTRWPISYQKWCQGPSAPGDGIQFIHGHRKFETDSAVFFHFSILSKDRTNASFESWMDERDLQLEHGPAVLTYWRSNPGARAREAKRHPRVPDRLLQIHSHYYKGGTLYLEVQYVGKSALKKDLKCISAVQSKKKWEEETREYLAKQNLEV